MVHRYLTLIKSMFLRDFHTTVPLIVWFCLICLVLAAVTCWFKSLMEDVFAIINREFLGTFRYQDVAQHCFNDCRDYYPRENASIAIEKCFVERPYQLFDK